MIGSTTTDAGQPAFVPVGVLNTRCSTSGDVVRRNIEANMRLGIPRLHKLREYGKYVGLPIALAAGGPSLDQTLDELRLHDRIMACGSAHDPLIDRGFIPDWAVINDADPSVLDFLKYADHRTCYLVASMCDPVVFKALRKHRVVMWHSFQGELHQFGDEARHAILGGCTVTLRALNIAILLGYMDIHFFGFDSSFTAHEYAYSGNPIDTKIIPVRVGDREFTSTPGWLAQATHFQEMCRTMGCLFTPTVHGDGLIAEMLKQGKPA